MTEAIRWKRRPEGANWGEFGADDQIGRLNLITPDKVKAALALAREGRTFCLSLPLDYPGGTAMNPRRLPPVLAPTSRDGKPNMTFPLSRLDPHYTDVVCDDQVTLCLQYSTQWDSLAHMGQMFDADGDGVPEMVFYNGYRAGSDVLGPVDYRDGQERPTGEATGARALGIEQMAATCVQGRGVMIDLGHHLPPGTTATFADIARVMDEDGIEVGEGDLVCLRTGFDEALLGMARQPDATLLNRDSIALDGRDPDLLAWITRSGLAALIADNPAVERLPPGCSCGDAYAFHPLHDHCLFRLGVHLGEYWLLSPLAAWLRAQGRSSFLLTAPPLRLPGAVGSPVTPVATV